MNTIKNCLRIFNSVKLMKNVSPIHTSSSLNSSQFYPINDDVFGLNEDQKQVGHIKKEYLKDFS